MNLESRQRLADFVVKARGRKSYRAYGKLIGVSATTVQAWERLDSMPETENLKAIAASAGYNLQELLAHLEGQPLPEPAVDQIVRQIQSLPLKQVAVISQAIADRFASVDC